GELLRWGGFSLETKEQKGFHKLKTIEFDRKGNLWALNAASELAVWSEEEKDWDIKEIPGALRPVDFAFDTRNRLWVLGAEGNLLLLSGSKWINFGFVGCLKLKDISFKAAAAAAAAAQQSPKAAEAEEESDD
ncbi:hypothetical protein, conserved, partial [Eimeria tenella]